MLSIRCRLIITTVLYLSTHLSYTTASVPAFSPDVEIAIDVLEAKEVTFTLVTNQKRKSKSKVPSPSSGTLSDSRSKT